MLFLRRFDNREAARAARKAAEGRSRLVSFSTTILRLRPPFQVCEKGDIVHTRVHSPSCCDSQTPKTLPTDPLPPARFRVATARGHLPTLHWPRPDNEGEARSSLAGGRSQVFGLSLFACVALLAHAEFYAESLPPATRFSIPVCHKKIAFDRVGAHVNAR